MQHSTASTGPGTVLIGGWRCWQSHGDNESRWNAQRPCDHGYEYVVADTLALLQEKLQV